MSNTPAGRSRRSMIVSGGRAGAAVTTRVAGLALTRGGRHRGLTYDDHMVRAALVVDLALVGALEETAEAVVTSVGAADAAGLGAPCRRLLDFGGPLDRWVYDGRYGWDEWSRLLLGCGVWRDPQRWWQPGPRYRPVDVATLDDDRAAARSDVVSADWTPTRTAVVAIGSVSALFRRPRRPPPVAGLGAAAWAVELAVEHLAATRARLRTNAGLAD